MFIFSLEQMTTRCTGVVSPQIDILAEAYAECGLVHEDSLVCCFLSLYDAVSPPPDMLPYTLVYLDAH